MSTRVPAFPGPGWRARSSPRCGREIPPEKGPAACRFRVGSREGEAVPSFPFESGWREPAAALGGASAIRPGTFAFPRPTILRLSLAGPGEFGHYSSHGGMAERLKAHAWKACIRYTPYRGFESHSLRQVAFRTLPENPKHTKHIAIRKIGSWLPQARWSRAGLGPPSSWAGHRAAARRGRAQVRKRARTRQGTSEKLRVRASS